MAKVLKTKAMPILPDDFYKKLAKIGDQKTLNKVVDKQGESIYL